jgi:hypothetical protein
LISVPISIPNTDLEGSYLIVLYEQTVQDYDQVVEEQPFEHGCGGI